MLEAAASHQPGSDAPLVSIVLPTYNGAERLIDVLEACRAQTLEDWELIVVDDGSDDGRTPGVIDRLERRERRLRRVRHAVNRRLPAALNSGFANARAGLFTWVADDDRLRPNALQVMVEALERSAPADVVYAPFSVHDEAGDFVRPGFSGPPEDLLTRGNVVGVCFLYRRRVHEALDGYREAYFLAEDYDFWLRASGPFRFERVDEDLAIKREHSQSLTALRKGEVARVSIALLDDFRSSHPELPRWRCARLLGLTAAYAERAGDRSAARRYLWAGARADPRLVLERRSMIVRLALGPRLWRALSSVRGRVGARSGD